MAKAAGTAVILAKGVPMLFMGQGAGEDHPFYLGMGDLNDPTHYLRPDIYEQAGEMNRILAWSRLLLSLGTTRANACVVTMSKGYGTHPRRWHFSETAVDSLL